MCQKLRVMRVMLVHGFSMYIWLTKFWLPNAFWTEHDGSFALQVTNIKFVKVVFIEKKHFYQMTCQQKQEASQTWFMSFHRREHVNMLGRKNYITSIINDDLLGLFLNKRSNQPHIKNSNPPPNMISLIESAQTGGWDQER